MNAEQSYDANLAQQIRRIERLAELLDTRFQLPVIGYRVGLDGLIGLLPGIGDAASGALAAYLIARAYRLGVRKRVLLKMIWNAVFDFLIGLIPVVGDLFDFVNKSNAKNAQLILKEYDEGRLDGQR